MASISAVNRHAGCRNKKAEKKTVHMWASTAMQLVVKWVDEWVVYQRRILFLNGRTGVLCSFKQWGKVTGKERKVDRQPSPA